MTEIKGRSSLRHMIFLEYSIVLLTVACAALYVVRHFYRTFSRKACGKGDCGCTVAAAKGADPSATAKARPGEFQLPVHLLAKEKAE